MILRSKINLVSQNIYAQCRKNVKIKKNYHFFAANSSCVLYMKHENITGVKFNSFFFVGSGGYFRNGTLQVFYIFVPFKFFVNSLYKNRVSFVIVIFERKKMKRNVN